MPSVNERFELAEAVAVVTGGLGNLGPVWCQTILEAGGRVAALDLPGAQPSEAFQKLQAQYDLRLRFYEADVTDKAALQAQRQRIEAEMGPVDILVNNAGIDQPPGPAVTYTLPDIPLEAVERVLKVNTVGAFLAMQVFGEGMVARNRGSIINIGSLYASVSPDERLYEHLALDPPFLKPPAYGASKAALLNLTRYFAAHWGKYGVRVNALSPGGVLGRQDEQFKAKFCARVPLGRMAELEDLQGPLLFLASAASAYVTGIELKIDGGFTLW